MDAKENKAMDTPMTRAEWDQLEAEWRELWTQEGIDWRTAYDPIPVLLSADTQSQGEDCPRCGLRAEHQLGTTHEGASQWRCEACQLPFMIFSDIGEEPEGTRR